MSDPASSTPAPEVTPDPQGPASPPGNSSAPAAPEYEFTTSQNEVLDGLTNGILWVRLPLFITGFFQTVIATGLAFRLHRDGAHIVAILGHAMAAIVCFLLAGWLLRAAAAFTRVTTTTGRDITNLMTGIRNLAVWFEMLAFFVKMYLVLLVFLSTILLIGLLAGAFRGPG